MQKHSLKRNVFNVLFLQSDTVKLLNRKLKSYTLKPLLSFNDRLISLTMQ